MNKRCCCQLFAVREGTIIIAFLSVFGTFCGIVYSSYTINVSNTLLNELEADNGTKFNEILHDEEAKEKLMEILRFVITKFITILIFTIIEFLLSIGLLFGGIAKSTTTCIPWYYYNLFFAILGGISGLVYSFFVLINFDILIGFACFIVTILVFLVRFYLLCVVKDYIWELREDKCVVGKV